MAAQSTSIAERLRALPAEQIPAFVRSLEIPERIALIDAWKIWALPHQRMPGGRWRRWVLRAGRGGGKTHTGAKTTHEVARDRKKIRRGEIGLIARTWDEARLTMVEGPSGLLANAPADFRPVWEPSMGVLRWPNMVRGRIFAAEHPGFKKLRGPNFAWIWADEVEHWPNGEETWFKVIEPALRIGWARAILTSTPRKGSKLLTKLEAKRDTVLTRAGTKDNPYLPQEVRDTLYEYFSGTNIGKQELDGEIIDEVEGALWTLDMIKRVREVPCDLARVVVANDPAVSDNPNSAEHGIIGAGRGVDGNGYVLADRSRRGSPGQWTSASVALYRLLKADAIVAEVNQGGDLVEAAIRVIDKNVKVRQVRATRGKIVRAEPVAALYERGKIFHVGDPTQFAALEDQLVTREPGDTKGFDRFDALVWALTDLMLKDRVGPLSAYL